MTHRGVYRLPSVPVSQKGTFRKTAGLQKINLPANDAVKTKKEQMKKFLIMAVIMSSIVVATGCNVTRTITTQSQYYQKGDTTCTIVTKTIETYEASKNN
jgi:hypothetical protein